MPHGCIDSTTGDEKGSQDGLGAAWDAIDSQAIPEIGPVSKAFLLAGRAHFTAENLTSGQRFTFRITRVDPEEGGKYQMPAWFAGVLVGPDNERHYDYLGMVKP